MLSILITFGVIKSHLVWFDNVWCDLITTGDLITSGVIWSYLVWLGHIWSIQFCWPKSPRSTRSFRLSYSEYISCNPLCIQEVNKDPLPILARNDIITRQHKALSIIPGKSVEWTFPGAAVELHLEVL